MKQKKLKRIITSMLGAMICSAILAQGVECQDAKTLPGSFEVNINKRTIFRFEPVFAEFKATLPFGDEKPSFARETSVKVTFQGETKDFGLLSQSEMPQRLPAPKEVPLLGSRSTDAHSVNDTYCGVESLERVEEFFPVSGVYQIQFLLHASSGTMVCDPIEITVTDPSGGVDKHAFDMLKKYEQPMSFSWVWKEKNGLSLLENFVEKYGDSVYGEMAIRYLANVYKAKDELDKAQMEFEKIKSSENSIIAKEANSSLADISKRKADIQKVVKLGEKPR